MSLPYPEPASQVTTKVMKANKSKDTKPEIALRRALRDAGYPGYRLHWNKAPGHPDICYPGRKVAIFVNGCFWHRCPFCNLPLPKRNQDYWIPKFQRNVERDRMEQEALESEGWKVFVVWECQLNREPGDAVSGIVSYLSGGTAPEPSDRPPTASSSSRRS